MQKLRAASNPPRLSSSFRLTPLNCLLYSAFGMLLPLGATAQTERPASAPVRDAVLVAQAGDGNTPALTATKKNANGPAAKAQATVVAMNDLGVQDYLGLPSYSTAFLQGIGPAVDIRSLLSGSEIFAGTYRVDIYVNSLLAGRQDVTFSANPATGEVEPCFTTDMLTLMGVDMAKLQEAGSLAGDGSCHRIREVSPQATARYDAPRLRLDVNVPQASMSQSRRGYVDPSLWSDGVPAAYLNYNYNTRYANGSALLSSNQNSSLGLRGGMSMGGWHLHNNSFVTTGTGQSTRFRSQNTYVQRDIASLSSQLWVGDTYTNSQLFDGVRFRGVQMASDEAMRPDNEQGYAPVIRGVAESNATVEVRQNGFLLYTANVAPGPFEISDLAPSGSNGNLEITVVEADGRRRTTLQAFSSPPLMVREGRLKYDATVGQFRQNYYGTDTPMFGSASMLYGLTGNLTLAGGMQASAGYQIYTLGAGLNTPYGAVSLDGSQSRSSTYGKTKTGDSLRLLYGKFFEQSSTNVSVSVQRSLSDGFRTLSGHVAEKVGAPPYQRFDGFGDTASSSPRNLFSVYLNQNLGSNSRYGNLYLSASDARNWDSTGSRSVSAGYSNSFGNVSVNLAYTHSRNSDVGYFNGRHSDNLLSLTLAFPLGAPGPSTPNAYTTVSHQKSGTSALAGVSGMLPVERDVSYSINAGRDSDGAGSASGYLSTQTSLASLNAGYSYGSHLGTATFGASGSIVAHQGGVNLGLPVGETFMLAQIDPPVPNVPLSTYRGAATGSNGYAVVPSAVPYRSNWIGLSSLQMDADIELDNGRQQVVPRRGAVALATFKSNVGRRVQFELTQPDGTPMPFGAIVEQADGLRLGITDPRGRVLTMLDKDQVQGDLYVRWDGKGCRIPFSLPAKVAGENYQRSALSCAQAEPERPKANSNGSGLAKAASPASNSTQGS